MDRIKQFLTSPEGAAAISGLLRAAFAVAIGFGAAISQPQVDSLIILVSSVIAVVGLIFTGFSVAAVRTRANQEEFDAAITGEITANNPVVTVSPN